MVHPGSQKAIYNYCRAFFHFETSDFDLIVSNPPYIKAKADRLKVHSQVEKFEPHLALFLKDEEYDSWFKEFFNEVFDKLKPGGIFWMEGHEDHLQELAKMAQDTGFVDVKIDQDLTNRDRFLRATKVKYREPCIRWGN